MRKRYVCKVQVINIAIDCQPRCRRMSFASNVVDLRCFANEQPKVVIWHKQQVLIIKSAENDVKQSHYWELQ